MKISDLTGLSKPLTRLIEVIASGIGAVSRPYFIKREADAHAYEGDVWGTSIGILIDNRNGVKSTIDPCKIKCYML